ncbi:FecR domain-containing protein [Roseateles depolymerans]|uniref:Uncharacterized protein n=1 Tax=Roseateles depolymerans TaxID=76731 RepID=A0A0U3CD45_9BURK|nr:FecR domain-containing protein [Roseateles depolymerans]ALV06648.1 hypothetical protein RD2015_2176 [Roseateles depolymerans]REG19625.1 FecR family protein [Roseateles depolymerans]
MSDAAVNPQHLAQAADWHLRLSDSAATEADHAAWRDWLAQADGHRLAWQRMERLKDLLALTPSNASQALRRPNRISRRQALSGLGAAGGLGALAIVALVMRSWSGREMPIEWMTTDAGERRAVTLPDGGQLLVAPETRWGIAYSPTQRTLHLSGGALQLQTAPDPLQRPLQIHTRDGRITPLGTRLTVEQSGRNTVVAVQAHAVEVWPEGSSLPVRVLQGQKLRFFRGGHEAVEQAGFADEAWTRGMLVVMDQRLDIFLRDFQRHSGAAMRGDPSISGLRVSGSFLITQPQRSLATLADQLGLRLEQRGDTLVLRPR